MVEYTLQEYYDYIMNTYSKDYECADSESLEALQESEERVYEWLGIDSCSCTSLCCACTEEIIKNAIFILAYFRTKSGNYRSENNVFEYEKTAYRYLKRNGCISF